MFNFTALQIVITLQNTTNYYTVYTDRVLIILLFSYYIMYLISITYSILPTRYNKLKYLFLQ